MKKSLVLISMLALAMSCETMYGPVQTPVEADEAAEIDIQVNSTDDNTASFTLTPAGEAAYYSYLVDQADAAEELDASLLYSCKYASVAQGTVKWTADATSATIELAELLPNTTYQIYAVAGSPMGIPGSVVTTSFKTSDKVAPELLDFEVVDNVVTVLFSENVLLGEGSITANYYAYNDPGFAEMKHVGTVTADLEAVVVDGSVVTVEFSGLPVGAHYAVNWPEGMFKDPAGNVALALESAMILDLNTWETAGKGVYGRRELGTFAIGALSAETISDWESPLIVDFGSEYGYGYTLRAAEVTATYSHAGKTTSYTLANNTNFAYVSAVQGIVIMLPDEPARGDMVTLSIAAESFEDLYGNLNEAWEASALYVYEYTMDDILGAFAGQYLSALEGETLDMNLVFEAVTEEDTKLESYIPGCNVKLTTLLVPTQAPVFAKFEPTLGKLTVPTFQIFYQMAQGEQTLLLTFITVTGGQPDTATPTVFYMPESGVLTCDTMFGILMLDGATGQPVSWYDVSMQFMAQKGPAAAAVAPTALPKEFKSYPLGTELIVK